MSETVACSSCFAGTINHTKTCVTYFHKNPHLSPRWQIQRGVGVIPKSVFPNELTDNLGAWGWTLNQEDMEVFMILIILIPTIAIIICYNL